MSYNNNLKTPNWVSYQLNKTWFGNADTIDRPAFGADPHLPFITNQRPTDTDIPKSTNYQKGHMTTASQRNRNIQDYYSTYLMSDIIPQPLYKPNGDRWRKLEEALWNLVDKQNKEVYIITGRDGETSTNLSTKNINVPSHVWKVVLVLDRPGQGIADVTANNLTFAINLNNEIDQNNNGQDQNNNWTEAVVSVRDLESLTGYNFLSNISDSIQDAIEIDRNGDLLNRVKTTFGINTAPLMAGADEELVSSSVTPLRMSDHTSIGHNGLPNQVATSTDHLWVNIGILEAGISQDAILKDTAYGATKTSTTGVNTSQVSFSENSTATTSKVKVSTLEVGTVQNGFVQTGVTQISPKQIGSSQISLSQIDLLQISSPQTDISQIGSFQTSNVAINSISFPHFSDNTNQLNPIEITFPRLVTFQQFIGSNSQNSIFPTHDLTSNYLTQLQSTLPTYWNIPTNFNLIFNITDLPTGQLAEATITGYDTNNRPNSGTLTLDTDGNGLGWFIDTTPNDNSEFTTQLADTAYKATAGSAAYGKYDLLTTILHELGHLNGIIRGNNAFDAYVQNINGVPTFIDGGITATLTPDGSHLDTTFHPYDLMNTSLKPGVRKLPSALNLAMIDAINAGVGGWVSGVGTLNSANLTAGALIGINNGNFNTTADWNTLGATNIINGTATLTEQSQKLSELTQAFIIPTGAKTLQFTIKDNHLVGEYGSGGVGGNKAPGDAFEVALLDSNTFNPLAGTIGLTHSDSLLNIQANGTIHKSDKVTITALGNNSSIVTIDLTQVTPTTQATLYFNLLGFGARTSTVTIDDVKLFTDIQPIPVTTNDTLITTQNTPLTLDPTQLTTNDTNVTQIQIINQPTHGTLTQTPDGKFTYQPVSTYVGNDSFTYLGFGSDGQISNLATVNISVNNLAPTIETVLIPNQINEGQTIQLTATATDGGSSDNLTYTWDLGDGTQPVIGRNITHQFADNGTYNVNLTVTDKDGGTTQQSTQITVNNVAPTATITTPNTTLNQGETLNLSVNYSDAGIKDTHTITWNFGDGTAPVTLVGALGFEAQPNLQSHVFTKSGTHNVTVTVTDNDGASLIKYQ